MQIYFRKDNTWEWKSLFLMFIVFLVSVNTFSQNILYPYRTESPPVIDGLIQDQTWSEALQVTGFQTYLPDYSGSMSEATVVYLAYDAENLYFAFRCYDSRPDKIKANMSPRDKIFSDDWMCINFDSFYDQQGIYAFYINPLGIQQDSRFSGGQEDHGFDAVWYSAGTVDSIGYNIEVKIPLKSIRYSNIDTVTMGMVFERYISRKPEAGTFPALDPDIGMNFPIQTIPVKYIKLKKNILFEALPAVTYNRKHQLEEGKLDLVKDRAEFSLTSKLGITSDLILDATYNPDFSQIEADAQQVDINLRYSLYYQEKRPFFLEGKDNFNVATQRSSEVDPLYYLLYTRTIVNPKFGAKITGKIGSKNTIASLYAIDKPLEDEDDEKPQFGIMRYKRTLKGDSYIGGIGAIKEQKHSYNRIGGIDGLIRFTDSHNIAFDGIISQTKPNDSVNKQNGYTTGLVIRQFRRKLDLSFAYREISKDFKAEMGYITRTGIRSFSGLVKPKAFPATDMINRIIFEAFSAHTLDLFSDKWETFNHASMHIFFPGNLSLKVKYSYSTEIFRSQRFKTGGFHIFGGGQLHKRLTFSVLYRRINAIYYSEDPYQGVSNQLSADLEYQPFEKLNTTLGFIYFDFARFRGEPKVYEYPITRVKISYQFNKYLFFRGIAEYNRYRNDLLTDFLISFTYIPGTVIYLGYGSLYECIDWNGAEYINTDRFREARRGVFFKASYLFRL